ncbi:hypothetical protein [Nevskia soli]|uniref:hypothetical protein n=1 Tax=Nevskia soli TaxID=418856 RepID=UPI0012FCFE26|nr:hypothetical protein [Nevskia soli]
MDDFYYPVSRPTTVREWRALPDDIKAGIFEEISELREQDRHDQHWAWPFIQPFLDFE